MGEKRKIVTIYSHINKPLRFNGFSSLQLGLGGAVLIFVGAILGLKFLVPMLIGFLFLGRYLKKHQVRGNNDPLGVFIRKSQQPKVIVDRERVIHNL